MAEATKAIYLRGIDHETYRWLKIRAAQHERSMQAELRAILDDLKQADESADNSIGAALDDALAGSGGFDDLVIPAREGEVRWAEFSE